MEIMIYGPGCPRCKATEKNVLEALAQLKKEAKVTQENDILKFAKAGVMFTPAVAIDGEVKIAGKVPSVDEIKKMLS
ncbi:thioredoxin family protein [Candidatus Margulisiibacteriota bacterium]